jgi:chromate transport protein ChrA
MSSFEQIDRPRLQQRLRALLIVASLLAPTFCVFGMLALLVASGSSSGWVLWLLLALWVIAGALLGIVIARILKTLRAINESS